MSLAEVERQMIEAIANDPEVRADIEWTLAHPEEVAASARPASEVLARFILDGGEG